ncbi:AAA family ATPase [Luteolibacter flavescens]|uniref:AAA family ATPase n=1 Tax=Luteolibacter flavescens TaxID=1859460 RepID=A0ABT3FQ43_9BACT|nr:AAA family ATPase [Luteolibacter flavescens]MCW1885351.1 AAA family ATPase [Luteolibacter flavescens]
MSGEDRIHDPASAWEIWRHESDEACSRLRGEAGDAADLLKVLLAEATGLLEKDAAALLALRSGRAANGEPVSQLLAGLAAMGLDGLIMDERSAAQLPPPYRAERIGFLPGILSEPFCAHRLEVRKAVPLEIEVPARALLWEKLQQRIEEQGDEFLSVSISGPAGAGKSHLIGALATWLVSRGKEVARVSCLPTDVPGTFAAWRSLLGKFGGDRLAETIAAAGAALTLDETLVKNLVRFLSGPVHADTDDIGLSPLQYKDILPEFIAGVLARLLAGRDCAAIIDDIQWMDEGSHGVTEALRHSGTPLLLVLGRRGQPAPDDIVLGPMSGEEHRKLLGELSGNAEITDALNNEILRISGGLPLVSREVYSMLSQRRRLIAMGGTLDLAPAGATADPLHETPLIGRFRDLSPRLRSLLGACAIWREPFTKEQAETTAKACVPGIEFETCWESPLLGEFIVATPGAPGRFSFYHDLLREAALSLMADRDRAAGHGAALEWMTARPIRDLSPAEAAFHARESGRDEVAVELFDRAARAALGRFALREAREAARAALDLDRANEHTGDPVAIALRARLYQIEGEAAFHWGMVEDAVGLLERAMVLYRVSPQAGVFPIKASMLLRHLWLFATGKPWADANVSPVREGAARTALMLAEIAYFQNDQKRSADCCVTALDLASKNGESAMLASLCAAIACPLSGRRPRWLADRYRNIARRMIARVGDRTEQTYIEHVGCLVDLDKTRWPEAAERAAGNVAYWRSHGHGRRVEEAATHAFFVDYFRGDLGRASEWAQVLQESAYKRTDRQSRTWAAMMGSLHSLACLGTKEAEAHCRKVPVHGGDAITQSSIHVMRAMCAWRSGNPWQAMDCLRDAEELAGQHPPVSSTQFLLADAAVLLGEMRSWGPPELEADPMFGGLVDRFMKRATAFAKSFSLGAAILHCARGLHGTGVGKDFPAAAIAARRLGADLFEARALCYQALKSPASARLQDGLTLLEKCGASAEVAFFQQLSSRHDRFP